MAYDEVSKQATLKYIKSKQQEIKIRYRKDEFDERIQPAIFHLFTFVFYVRKWTWLQSHIMLSYSHFIFFSFPFSYSSLFCNK